MYIYILSKSIYIDIPSQPPLQTIAAVRLYPFPSIFNEKLTTPKSEPQPFLQFHGSYFVILDQHTTIRRFFFALFHSPTVANSVSMQEPGGRRN